MDSTLVQADLLALRQNFSVVQTLQQRVLLEVVPHLSELHGWDQKDEERAKAFIRDTATIFRFFKRADQCQTKTIEALQAHLLWRVESKPEMIDFDHLDKSYVNLFKFMPEECCDRLDRPVAVLRLNKVKRSDDGGLERLKHSIIWSFECARRYLRDLKLDEQSPCLTFTVLVDLEGASMSNVELEILPFLLDMGRNQYPGLCSNVFILRFGWWWASAWTILKRLLPTSTLAKITFPSEKELFQLYFERSSLPPEFNGRYISSHGESSNEVQLRYSRPEFSSTTRLYESGKPTGNHQPNCVKGQQHSRSSSFFEPEIETRSSPRSSGQSADDRLVGLPNIIPDFPTNIELTLPKFRLFDGSETSHVLSTPSILFPSTHSSAESPLGSEISSHSQASSATRRRTTMSEISTVSTPNLFEIDPFVARTYAKEITTHHLGALEPIAPADTVLHSVFASSIDQPDDLIPDSADSHSVTSYVSCRSGSPSPIAFPTCTEISARPHSPSELAPRDRTSRDILRTIIFLIMLKTKNIRTRLALLLGFSNFALSDSSSPRHAFSLSSSSNQGHSCFRPSSQLANSRMITRRQPSGLSSSELKALVLATIVFVLREVYENLVPDVVVNSLGGGLSTGAGMRVGDAWGVLGRLVGLSG